LGETLGMGNAMAVPVRSLAFKSWKTNSISCMGSAKSVETALRGVMLLKKELSVHILVPKIKECPVAQMDGMLSIGHMISHKKQSSNAITRR